MAPPDADGKVDVTRASTGANVNFKAIHANENGAVYKLDGDRSALFMGDVQDDTHHYAESWLIQQHDDPESAVNLDADVLFVGHHGSANATSAEFLERVDPEVAAISSDLGEKFDHPREEVLENLHKHDVDVYWTAGHGTIRTDLDEALTIDQTKDLETTAAADLAALKHYCGEQDVTPEAVKTLAPGNLPEETSDWVAEAPMIAETPKKIVDAAITNAETVEEVRQTLDESPEAADHLRDVVQTDRRDIVPSQEELEANRQDYEDAKEAQNWEPTLGKRLRMSLPNRFGGIDPPYQDVPVPEDIEDHAIAVIFRMLPRGRPLPRPVKWDSTHRQKTSSRPRRLPIQRSQPPRTPARFARSYGRPRARIRTSSMPVKQRTRTRKRRTSTGRRPYSRGCRTT